MNIAVVILNWNGRKLLNTFLPTVVKFSEGYDIYVIDNGSEDDSLDFLNRHFPTVGVVSLPNNKGYAGGYNEGLKSIKADVYCLLNSDVRVTENWLHPFVICFQNHPEVAIAQPHIMDLQKPTYFEYAGAAGGYIDRLGYPFCRGRIFNILEKDEGQYDENVSIFWASGACFFIRSNTFKDLGGFDTDFFLHQEEIDLCWRTRNSGQQIVSVAATKVYHFGGASLPETFKKVYLNHRNSLFTLLKNLPKRQLLPVFISRFFWEGVAILYYAVKLKPLFSIAVLYAHFSFWKHALRMWRKRSKKNISQYYEVRSILLQRYFAFKKIFTQLSIVKN